MKGMPVDGSAGTSTQDNRKRASQIKQIAPFFVISQTFGAENSVLRKQKRGCPSPEKHPEPLIFCPLVAEEGPKQQEEQSLHLLHLRQALQQDFSPIHRQHQGQAQPYCYLCNKSFTRIWSLNRHMADTHCNVVRSFECDVCHRVYRSKNSLVSHRSQYHTSGAGRGAVSLCEEG
ncbi:hypothetical protein J437_LFUL004041 [Ladona fulva]|uniref:C2H2-type domain-containing protein n=1 Tax=Ladona fulva TaxID=123851 RepID=A0A8K0JWK4_LADFU|nr:hypothetical protein J437_LFUL004041 [Ladona fulva]